VSLDAPYGRAYWRPQQRRTICVAGGSGLAPMLAVAEAARAAHPVEFFFGVRDVADAAVASAMESWGDTAALNIVVSDPTNGWAGQTGFVHEAVARNISAETASSYEYYVAGPVKMIDAMLNLLVIERKVPMEQIHYDRFV
jgi:toluene monooxygenase electron transfer component